MEKRKKTGLIILSVIGLLLIIYFVLNLFISNRIKNRIDEAIGKSSSYEEVDVSLLQRQVTIQKLDFNGGKRKLSAEKISLKKIGFFKYVFHDELVIGKLEIDSPEILFRKASQDSSSEGSKNFKRNIRVKELQVNNGTFRMKSKDTVGNEVYFRFPELNISGIQVDSSTVKRSIPFNYKDYNLVADSLRVNMNPEHYVAAGNLKLENGALQVKDLRILPYYGKTDFDRVIPYEKDRISLQVDSIFLDSLQFSSGNGPLVLKNNSMSLSNANLEVYRNKTLPDDPRKRPLYTTLLREASLKLDFKKIKLRNTTISYQEKVKADKPPATVKFTGIDADISNLTNVGLDRKDFPETKVHVTSSFQDVAPLEVDWSFKINDPEDKFLFSGKFGRVPGDALNSLLRPSMNMEAKGTIKDAWFTFSGNDDVLTGDVRLNYDQFKFVWLEKGGREKKGFFTAIANLFVDNDGISGDDKSREVRVERDPNRSFWAYVWQGLKTGVRKTFSQL